MAAGRNPPSDLDPWDATVAAAMAPLIAARSEIATELAPPFAAAAAELGLPGSAEISYAPRAEGGVDEIREGLAERREADLRLGRTSWGAHLDEFKLTLTARPCAATAPRASSESRFWRCSRPSASCCWTRDRHVPLLLLDDVMSELDPTCGGGWSSTSVPPRPDTDHSRRTGDALPAPAAVRASFTSARPCALVGPRRPDAARREPRRIGEALAAVQRQAAPKTPLAAVEMVWADVVGEKVAGVAEPGVRARRPA